MKDIPGYESFYAATEDGRIYSKRRNRYLNPKTKSWYSNVRLCDGSTQKPFKVHQLIALCFLPNPLNRNEVNHKNGIKGDNRVDNLEWTTRRENIKHSYSTLNHKRTCGVDHPKYRPSLDVSTGIFYDSMAEAAKAKNVSRHNIKNDARRNGLRYNIIFV
jgi:hypothetical protein